jgi:hypothetical protein
MLCAFVVQRRGAAPEWAPLEREIGADASITDATPGVRGWVHSPRCQQHVEPPTARIRAVVPEIERWQCQVGACRQCPRRVREAWGERSSKLAAARSVLSSSSDAWEYVTSSKAAVRLLATRGDRVVHRSAHEKK